MFHTKNVLGQFWAEAMNTVAFIINRLPQQRLYFLSPFEKLWNVKPTVSYFRVFGCVCYVFVPDYLRNKMDKKAVKCIFTEYDSTRKGWRCCDPTTGKCYTSRNVVFDEASSWQSSNNKLQHDSDATKDELQSTQIQLRLGEPEDKAASSNHEEVLAQSPWQTCVHEQANERYCSEDVQTVLRRSSRARKSNPRYANIAIVEAKEPETFEEAIQIPEWKKAMAEEIAALQQNQTWELVPKPKDANPISCKWVYKIKHNTNGSIERFKARLVARGFSQQYGLDYDETFSPVAKLTTVRVLLALAANKIG